MANYNNQQIIEGLRNRDNAVVGFIIVQNLPMVVYLVEIKSGTRQDAEDILQEALMVIIKKADKHELELTAKFSTFLYAVCNKLWLARCKERKSESNRIKVFVNDVYVHDSISKQDEEQRKSKFMYYYNQLSTVCRDIIKLYSISMTVEEIATTLHNTENYIRKRKYECKNRLITLIKNNGDKI